MSSTVRVPTPDFLVGGGEMGKLIGSMDWAKTPLGPIETWPQSLRTTVSLCVASNFPISLAWGPAHVQIYNDGYWPICGGKHPRSMGQNYTECWASAWPAIGDAFYRGLAGETSYIENQRMFLDRHGYLEETFFTFSFSPVRDESGGVGGLFHPVTEQTGKMLSERRTRALRDLAARTANAKTTGDVFALAAQTLAEYDLDLPFVLFYVLGTDTHQARLAASAGLAAGTLVSPERIDLQRTSLWALAEVAQSRTSVQINEVEAMLRGIGCGPYPESPRTVFAVPIPAPGTERPVAVMVAGVSSRLPLNEMYRGFYELLGSTVIAAVTNARAYEDERRRAEALMELDRAKTAFFSNVSHEFRTPLTLMLGPVEEALADTSANLPVVQRDRLEVAHRNALRLLKLVNALLDFSRIEAGRVQAKFIATDLAVLTAELASNFRSACDKAGIALVVDCAPLPEPVYVDREMWEKIVLNLVSNAFKFTFEGTINIGLQALGNDQVELTVRDTGTGIPEHELAHVFDRFHRVEGARGRSVEGSGIGLALVHELTKLHGGTVAVKSKGGSGSTFQVTLPLGAAHLPADRVFASPTMATTQARSSAFIEEALRWLPDMSTTLASDADEAVTTVEQMTQPFRGGIADGPQARVVLADDNADMRAYVRHLLETAGYRVDAFGNGAAALAACIAEPPNLVLTDVMMPEMDGFALLERLRGQRSTAALPVIMLSARAGEEARIEGLGAGADDYLMKPFGARELLARVEGAIRLTRVRRAAATRERALEAEVSAARAQAALHLSEARLELALEAGRLGSWDLDLANDKAVRAPLHDKIFGYDPALPAWGYGLFLQHVVLEDRNRVDEGFRATIDEGRDWHFECRIRRADGEVRWIEVFGRPTRGDKGFVDHILGIVADITDRKQEAERIQASLKEKDLLLGEIHHRVKNNLQIVESLLDLQAAQIEDPHVLDKLRDSRSRVRSMALVHRTLYQSADFARADFRSFLDALVPALITSYNVSRYRVAFTTDAEDVSLPIDAAIPCGLIVNELISNALKHAFSDGQCGEIDVTMKRHVGNQMVLSVSDNGAGIPDDLELESTATLGLQLVAGLASQLHGKLTIQRSKPTRFELTFPLVQ